METLLAGIISDEIRNVKPEMISWTPVGKFHWVTKNYHVTAWYHHDERGVAVYAYPHENANAAAKAGGTIMYRLINGRYTKF